MHFLIRCLETIFAVGVLGSVLVLILTTIEDIKVLFDREEKTSSH